MTTSFAPDTPYDNHDDLLTLTEKKELADSVQALGTKIVGLTDRQIRRVPLEGQLRTAIFEARRLTHHGARHRQLQFVGRLMRSADIEPLRQALDDLASGRAFITPESERSRLWVERLLAGNAHDVDAFMALAPTADRTRLSQLLRQHAKDVKVNKAEKSQRAVYAYVADALRDVPMDDVSPELPAQFS